MGGGSSGAQGLPNQSITLLLIFLGVWDFPYTPFANTLAPERAVCFYIVSKEALNVALN